MERVLSTYRWIDQPLSLSVVGEIAQSGIKSIEVFCAFGHFNCGSQENIRDLEICLREHGLALHSLHSPTERETSSGGSPISLADVERVRRLDAVDEVKRALDVAEQIPYTILVQHLAHGRQSSDPRKLDAAFNSLEHLVLFAKERGVTIALENTPGELTSPESLQNFIRETHLTGLQYCFDVGHAHLEDGVGASFEVMRDRIVTTHIHDNHADTDEHLLPYEGSVDWPDTLKLLGSTQNPPPMVLELKAQSSGAPAMKQILSAFDRLEEEMEVERPAR